MDAAKRGRQKRNSAPYITSQFPAKGLCDGGYAIGLVITWLGLCLKSLFHSHQAFSLVLCSGALPQKSGIERGSGSVPPAVAGGLTIRVQNP